MIKNNLTKVTLIYPTHKMSFNAPEDVVKDIKEDPRLKLVTDGLLKVYINTEAKKFGYDRVDIVIVG